MEIRTLKYFLAVAKHENITRAADELHLTQPTLSRQMNELEEELGVQLFIRGKRRTQLTEDGYFLKARAEEIVTLADKTITEFIHNDALIAGDIYLGCGETEAMRDVFAAITPLQKAYPHLRLHVLSGNEELIRERLEKGLLDFGVLCRQTPPVEYAYRELPHKDRWGVALRRDNPLAEKPALTFEDLRKEPLMLSRQVMEAKEFDHWLGESAESLQILATYNLHYNMRYLIEAGAGSLLTFEGLVEENENLVFRPLQPELLSRNYLIWRKDSHFSRGARLMQACFEESFS